MKNKKLPLPNMEIVKDLEWLDDLMFLDKVMRKEGVKDCEG